MVGAAVALQASFPFASSAIGDDPVERARQEGEDRWVPSLSITGGTSFQDQIGRVDSLLFEGDTPPSVPLRGFEDGDDFVVAPFVGASLELMTPAFRIPTRPRLFLSGEVLPTFASERFLALEGDPDCVSGPEPEVDCVSEEDGSRRNPFDADTANGQGSETTAEIDTLVFGANLGVAFPLRIGKRQLRIKPSIGWINYKVNARGLVVDVVCDPDPDIGCANWTPVVGDPQVEGNRRETILEAEDSKRFNGIGPGLDIEMDTGRFGPLGTSLFLGARAYYIVGDRNIDFGASESFDDDFGEDTAVARFNVEVDPWLFRAHVGLRIQWLGSRN